MSANAPIDELMSKGYDALATGDYPLAIETGKKLIALRHTSGFEIVALAYQRQDQIDHAIALLEEGVKKAPAVWILWKLLGDCYSDAKRFEDAENAYQSALTKPNADLDVIHLNRGIAFHRQEKWVEADEALFQVKAKWLRRRAMAELIHVAGNSGNLALAAERGLALSNQPANDEENFDRRETSNILSAIALGLFHGKDFIRAKEYALRAAQSNPANSEALWIIREVIAKRSLNAIGFTLILNGNLQEEVDGKKNPPFMRTLKVAAPDIDAALAYAREFFSDEVAKTLRVEEVNEFDASECTFEGVYLISGYFFYPRDNSGE